MSEEKTENEKMKDEIHRRINSIGDENLRELFRLLVPEAKPDEPSTNETESNNN